MAKKESATKKESASPVQVAVVPGTEIGEDVLGGLEAEGGGSSERCPHVVGITEKKRAADAVNEARLLAEGIVQTVREPLLVLDGQLHVQSVNDSFLKTFQVTPEETGNRLLYELGNGQWDIPSLRDLLEKVLPRDAWVVDFEVRHTFEKIGERTMLLNARRMTGKGSNEILLAIEDITEKKRAADAVNEARLLAEGIVQTVREPLLVLDGQLHVQSVNDSFLKTFQVTPEETGNRLLYELGNGQWDIPSLRDLLEKVLPRDAWVVDFEVRHTFEKIGERTMLLNARRMTGKGSNQILLAIEDVTERKLAEAQLKNANANLQQKNREMEEFAHTVSHDLKSPLVTIGGMLGLLKEELQEERLVAAGELIATAEETVVGMRDMIDDLLKLSRIGTVAIDLQPVGLRQVAEELVRKHAPQLEDKHTAVSLELSEDQPTVLADRNRLVEVLDNLIVNALKYACDGPEPRITIGSETVGSEVRLFVKDNGPGIGEEHHEKIFGLFERLDVSMEGTGVGLAIVKRIMEVHGGRVWVESAIGEGATFWLAFPAAVDEAAMSLSAQGRRGRA